MIFMGSVLSDGWSVITQQASPEEWVHMVMKFKLVHCQPALVIPMIYGMGPGPMIARGLSLIHI